MADGDLRLFVALTLPEPVLDGLARWSESELSTGRRIGRSDLHVTIAFLGRRPRTDLPAVLDAVEAVGSGASPFLLEPLRWRETRSVGMVVLADPSGEAVRLARELHTRLEDAGLYRREARQWLPHVTVLRFRERPRLHPSLPPIGAFAPSGLAAFLSRLHPSGARYEVLESVPLDRMRLRG
ncbi:MAG TPA: RNA 2',3'-cyclic phosphodiesterase [Gaiellaceae bacterium]|nr:RNA 2',3'-cyclic phosphodiesterase [Gaiellaceae bacterium]